jgi:hypothetical protein
MAYRLRMPVEIGDWLADLAGSQPEAAAEVVAALMALMQADVIPGQPLVSGDLEPPPSLYPDPDTAADPRETLDLLYQHQLEGLQRTRREAADAAASRARIEEQLGTAGLDPALRGALEKQLTAARKLEATTASRAQGLQLLVDRFRTDKETAKAMATAAEATERITHYAKALDAMPSAEDIGRAARDSAAQLGRVLAQGRRLLAAVRAGDPASPAPVSLRENDVLKLRADPLGSGAVILFAEEPVGTLTLLSVMDDSDAVSEHHDAAADLAGLFLEEIRDDGWPAESPSFADPEVVAERFLPSRYSDLATRAAARAATVTLTTVREQASMSMPRVAELAGLNEGRVKLLELRGPADDEVEVLAAYARALGGTLRLTIELDGTGHTVG